MILYSDTSSLLKLYINEKYSPLVHRWARQADVLCSSRVAGDLAIKHGLRGFDAIHLALAAASEIARVATGVPFYFSSFDARLNKAAAAERFTVLDENAALDEKAMSNEKTE